MGPNLTSCFLDRRPNDGPQYSLPVARIQDTEKAPLQFQVTDAEGEILPSVATVTTDGAVGAEGNPVLTIVDNGDGTFEVESSDVGVSTLTIVAAGTNPDGTGFSLQTTLDVEVVASDAVTLTATLGTPEPK